MLTRSSGVLMHITSLPNAFGIGSFGQSAYDFVDFLVETKQTYWQILPLTTTSYGDSPYQSFSAIAGNTHLIDFDLLTQMGLLKESDYVSVNFGDDPTSVDYERVFYARRPILEIAVKNFLENSITSRKTIDYGWTILLSLWQLKSISAIKHYKNGMIKKLLRAIQKH